MRSVFSSTGILEDPRSVHPPLLIFNSKRLKAGLFVLASAGLIYLISKRDADNRRKEYARTAYQAGLIKDVTDALISIDMQSQGWSPGMQRAEKIYGWKASELIGKSLDEFLKTEYPDEGNISIAYKQLIEKGYWKEEVTQLKKDGSRFPALVSVSFVMDENGARIGMVGVHRDISERNALMRHCAIRNVIYRPLVENSLQEIAIIRIAGRLCNPDLSKSGVCAGNFAHVSNNRRIDFGNFIPERPKLGEKLPN